MRVDGIPNRGLKSAVELGARFDHGTRMRYRSGCHCSKCRRSNTDYENERRRARAAGDWNGIVQADKARRHLIELRRAGVGRRAVRMATDVSRTVLQTISAGKKQRIRRRTERLILAVTPAAACDGAYIPATRTWWEINQLLREGFTKARISAEIGQDGIRLQLGKERVTVRSAAAVNRVWRKYMTAATV